MTQRRHKGDGGHMSPIVRRILWGLIAATILNSLAITGVAIAVIVGAV